MQPVLGTPAVLVFATVVAVAMAILPAAGAARRRRRAILGRCQRGTYRREWSSARRIVLAITEAAETPGRAAERRSSRRCRSTSPVLAVFAHQLEGAGSAIDVVRGLQIGLFGTIVFFLVGDDDAIEPWGILPAFAVAIAAVAAVQTVSLRILRRPISGTAPAP